jgi:hypothetical protein
MKKEALMTTMVPSRQHCQKKVKPSKVEREVGQLKTMRDIETFLSRRNRAAYQELVDWKAMFNTARELTESKVVLPPAKKKTGGNMRKLLSLMNGMCGQKSLASSIGDLKDIMEKYGISNMMTGFKRWDRLHLGKVRGMYNIDERCRVSKSA